MIYLKQGMKKNWNELVVECGKEVKIRKWNEDEG